MYNANIPTSLSLVYPGANCYNGIGEIFISKVIKLHEDLQKRDFFK